MYGHIKKRKRRGEFLQFCRYLRSLHPPQVRIAVVCDNFSPHLSTRKDKRVGQWAAASNAEFAYTPTNSSWMNRLECQFTALREFTLNGTDYATHREQGRVTRRYTAWRNRHTSDRRPCWIDKRANVACYGARRRVRRSRPAQPHCPRPTVEAAGAGAGAGAAPEAGASGSASAVRAGHRLGRASPATSAAGSSSGHRRRPRVGMAGTAGTADKPDTVDMVDRSR